jgi:hypothetical protein|eukprot:7381170-Prymnesium_polylepis.3
MWPAQPRAAAIAYGSLAQEHLVVYRHNIASRSVYPNAYFPTAPFVIRVLEIAPAPGGRKILVIERVDNGGRWEDGSVGQLPVYRSMISFVDEIEDP